MLTLALGSCSAPQPPFPHLPWVGASGEVGEKNLEPCLRPRSEELGFWSHSQRPTKY